MERAIGVFDSGVGGLTVVNSIRSLLPNENIIYIGDNYHCPYGDKTPEQLFSYASGIVEYFIMKKLNLAFNNFLLNLFITSYSSIIIYLVIFLPIYNIIGENMIVSISLLVVVIILESIISYYILNYRNLGSIYNIISVVMLIIGYIGFVYLTYKPIRNYIFYDKLENKYGIDIYVLDE